MNVFALQLTQGKSIVWQSPVAAVVESLQPGIVEEVIYRFALLGPLWLALHKTIPRQAAWLAGLLALLVHTFMHFDDMFLQAPLLALGMGLPPTILLRRDLESAIAFHWIQDLARFITELISTACFCHTCCDLERKGGKVKRRTFKLSDVVSRLYSRNHNE